MTCWLAAFAPAALLADSAKLPYSLVMDRPIAAMRLSRCGCNNCTRCSARCTHLAVRIDRKLAKSIADRPRKTPMPTSQGAHPSRFLSEGWEATPLAPHAEGSQPHRRCLTENYLPLAHNRGTIERAGTPVPRSWAPVRCPPFRPTPPLPCLSHLSCGLIFYNKHKISRL